MIKRTLYFGNPTYLSLRNKQLVIKMPEVASNSGLAECIKEEAVITKPIEDIGVVVLDNKRITLTTGVMDALLANNCALITCDDRGMPVGLMLPLCGNTTQSERFRQQIEASLPLKKQLWQQTVQCKINNQAAVLQKCRDIEVNCMRVWAKDVRSGDSDNLEGRAAAYYWKHLFSQYIEGFVRDRDGVSPNNLLNYGYAILRAVIARALVSSGLLPTLGIHHHNRYNAYCLADDIMEPYRPFVDQLVIYMMKRYEDISELNTEMKRDLLGLAYQDVLIDGKRSPMQIAIQTTANSVYKCFSGEARKIIYPDW